MGMRLTTLVVWALAALSAVFWASRFAVKPAAVPGHAVTVSPTVAPAGNLVRLFGAPSKDPEPEPDAAPAPADARFKLVGVAAPRQGQRAGLALIGVDDKPARAVALGATVDGNLVVMSIGHRQVELGPSGGKPSMVLSLPALPEPARGAPTPAATPPAGAMPPPAPPFPTGAAPAGRGALRGFTHAAPAVPVPGAPPLAAAQPAPDGAQVPGAPPPGGSVMR